MKVWKFFKNLKVGEEFAIFMNGKEFFVKDSDKTATSKKDNKQETFSQSCMVKCEL